MAFPTVTTLQDDFNRADENPVGAPFAAYAIHDTGSPVALKIVGGALAGQFLNGNGFVPSPLFDMDNDLQFVIATPPATDLMDLFFNLRNTGTLAWTGCVLEYYSTFSTWSFKKHVAAGPSIEIAFTTLPILHAGDSVGIESRGAQVTCYHKLAASGTWTEIFPDPIIDLDIIGMDGGGVGFSMGDAALRIDSWSGGSVNPPDLRWKKDETLDVEDEADPPPSVIEFLEFVAINETSRVLYDQTESQMTLSDGEGSAGEATMELIGESDPTAAATWQYILCHTPDPRDPTGELEEIGEIESARNRTLEKVRNRSGSGGCWISIQDDMAGQILDRVSLGDVRGTLRKSLMIRRNKVDLWSGPILTVQGSLSDGASGLTIGAVGWLEYLFHRFLYVDKHFNEMPQDQIVVQLLAMANAQQPSFPIPIFPGSVTGDMPRRSPTFTKGDSFGASVQKLSDVESGFDFDVNPRTRELDLFAWDSYTVHEDIKLGYMWGPENISKLDWNESGAQAVNRLQVTGNNGIPIIGLDSESIDDIGLFEENASLPVDTSSIIPAYIGAELAVRSRPQIVYTLTPKSIGTMPDDAPRLFDDFQIGEQVSFTAKEGYFQVKNQGIRVFGASVSITEEGVETINNLQTTPAS